MKKQILTLEQQNKLKNIFGMAKANRKELFEAFLNKKKGSEIRKIKEAEKKILNKYFKEEMKAYELELIDELGLMERKK